MANVNKIDLKNNGYANISYSEVFGSFSSARSETSGSYVSLYKSGVYGSLKREGGKKYNFQRQYFEFPKLNTNRTIKRAFFVNEMLERSARYVARQEWNDGNSFNEYCDVSLIESTDSASSYNSNMSTFPGFTTNKLVSKSEANRILDSDFGPGKPNRIRIELNDYIISKLTNKSNTICLIQHQDYENNPDMIENVDSEYKLELQRPQFLGSTYIEIEYEPYTACTGEGILLSSRIPNQTAHQWSLYNDSTSEYTPINGGYGRYFLITQDIISQFNTNTNEATLLLQSYDSSYIESREYFDVIFNSCPTEAIIYPNSIRDWKETNDVPISTVRKINDAESFGANLNKTPNSLTDKIIDTSPGYAEIINPQDLMVNYNDPENDNPKYIMFNYQDISDANEDIGIYYWVNNSVGWGIINPGTPPLTFPIQIRVKDNGTTNGRSKSFRYKVTDVGTPDHRYSTATGTITVNIDNPNSPPSQLTNITKTMDYKGISYFSTNELKADYVDPEGDPMMHIKFNPFPTNGMKIQRWTGSNWVDVTYANREVTDIRGFRVIDDGSVTSAKSHTFYYIIKDTGSGEYSPINGRLKVNVRAVNLPPNQLTNMEKSMAYNKSIKFRGAELQVDYNDPDGDKAKEFRFSNFNNQGIKLEYWSGSNWVEVNSLNNTAPGANTIKGFRDFRTRCDGSVTAPKSHTFKYKVKDVGSNQFSSVEGEIKINVGVGVVISDKFRGSSSSRQFHTSACNLSKDRDYWISSKPIGIGKIVYLNSSKNFKLNGGNNFYKLENSSFQVDNTGRIIGTGYLCL